MYLIILLLYPKPVVFKDTASKSKVDLNFLSNMMKMFMDLFIVSFMKLWYETLFFSPFVSNN